MGHACIRDRSPSSAAPVGRLLLGVEVDGGDRKAEVVLRREGPRAEVAPRRRRRHLLQPALLPEQHQHVPVDPHRRARPHVAHHHLPCCQTHHDTPRQVYVSGMHSSTGVAPRHACVRTVSQQVSRANCDGRRRIS